MPGFYLIQDLFDYVTKGGLVFLFHLMVEAACLSIRTTQVYIVFCCFVLGFLLKN